MEFTDLIALKIKELMKEKELSIYKLKSLTGVYTSTISQFLTRKTKTIGNSSVIVPSCFFNCFSNNFSNFIMCFTSLFSYFPRKKVKK